MTDRLYVAFKAQANAEKLVEEVKNFIKGRCQEYVPQNMLQHFRVVLLNRNNQYFLEPFIGGGSFEAISTFKKKKPHVNFLLSQIVKWARRYSEIIEIVFWSEADGNTNQDLINIECDLEDVLALKKQPYNHRFTIINRLEIFCISQVEITLLSPLRLVGCEQLATGFFRNYYLAVRDINQLFVLLDEEAKKNDGEVKDYGKIEKVKYHLLSNEIKEVFDFPDQAGVLCESGRVYFSE